MFDPTLLIGGLYKIPVFLAITYISFYMVWYVWGIPGIVAVLIGGFLLFRYKVRKEEESRYGF